jgi:hypothetical protein
MPEQASRPALAWLDMLDRIEESLAQSLRLTPMPAERSMPGPAGSAEPLRKLDERLARWQACLDQAHSNAAAADAALEDDMSVLVDWLSRASKAREMLEGWAGKAV